MKITAPLFDALAARADRWILRALELGEPSFCRARPASIRWYEVAAVRAVTVSGASRVARGWRPLLAGSGLKLSTDAVFCHSSPQVTYDVGGKRTSPCELADLLLVVDLIPDTAPPSRRAVLIQAKVAKPNGRIHLAPAGGDHLQFDLFTHWYPFDFQAQIYASQTWDIRSAVPSVTAAGAAYGGIWLDRKPHFWNQIPVSPAMALQGHESLGRYITGMAFGTTGRTANPSGGDPWSDLVNLLLRVTEHETYGKALPIKRRWGSISYMAGSSQIAHQSFFQSEDYERRVTFTTPPDVGDPSEFELRRDGPISTVHIQVGGDGLGLSRRD